MAGRTQVSKSEIKIKSESERKGVIPKGYFPIRDSDVELRACKTNNRFEARNQSSRLCRPANSHRSSNSLRQGVIASSGSHCRQCRGVGSVWRIGRSGRR